MCRSAGEGKITSTAACGAGAAALGWGDTTAVRLVHVGFLPGVDYNGYLYFNTHNSQTCKQLPACSGYQETCTVVQTPGPTKTKLARSSCKSCPSDTYSIAGASSCPFDATSCPAGTYASGTAACDSCPSGTYMHAGASSCPFDATSCPTGTYASGTATVCDSCGTGKYNGQTSQTSESVACKNCDAGKYQNQVGQSSESVACHDCSTGKYNEQVGQSNCKECGTGKYNNQNDQSNCKECGTGKFSDQTSQSSCKDNCNAGSYINSDKSACLNCIEGQYQDQDDQSSCKDNCNAGSYINSDKTDCLNCIEGQYQDQDDQSSCKDCVSPNVDHSRCCDSESVEINKCVSTPLCSNINGQKLNVEDCYCGTETCTVSTGRWCNQDAMVNNCKTFRGTWVPSLSGYTCQDTFGTVRNSANCVCGSKKCGNDELYCNEAIGTCSRDGKFTYEDACKSCASGTYSAVGASSCIGNAAVYKKRTSGNCGDSAGEGKITSAAACGAGAAALGWGDTTAYTWSISTHPPGCYYYYPSLMYNTADTNVACSSNQKCLCTLVCPPGTYQDQTGQSTCKECQKKKQACNYNNGMQENTQDCVCGSSLCSSDKPYCDASKSQCSPAPYCLDGTNDRSCMCGSNTCEKSELLEKNSGICASNEGINCNEECKIVARALGLEMGIVGQSQTSLPSGCGISDGKVWFNPDSTSTESCSDANKCLCRKQGLVCSEETCSRPSTCTHTDGFNEVQCACGLVDCYPGYACDFANEQCILEDCFDIDGVQANVRTCRCGATICNDDVGLHCLKTENTCAVRYEFEVDGVIQVSDCQQTDGLDPEPYKCRCGAGAVCNSGQFCGGIACYDSPKCTSTNGQEVNDETCMCNGQKCAKNYCNVDSCVDIPAFNVCGAGLNNETCRCGTDVCLSGEYCNDETCRNIPKCNVGLQEDECLCGTRTCAVGEYCRHNRCFQNEDPQVNCSVTGTLTRTVRRCNCGTDTCAADEYCRPEFNRCSQNEDTFVIQKSGTCPTTLTDDSTCRRAWHELTGQIVTSLECTMLKSPGTCSEVKPCICWTGDKTPRVFDTCADGVNNEACNCQKTDYQCDRITGDSESDYPVNRVSLYL